MARIEYHSRLLHKSWELPTKKDHETIEWGLWTKRTVDRPLQAHHAADPTRHFDFRYTPLDDTLRQIRVLRLYPGKPGDHLKGVLETISLAPEKRIDEYEALSYCWGEVVYESFIMIDEVAFRITANLFSALQRLRSSAETKTLWIDAICINQSDLAEKSLQVGLMTNIFSSASRVLAWLGPSAEHSDVAMGILEEFSKAKAFDHTLQWRAVPHDLVHPALTDIMGRQWFQRYWIIQEAALAKEVLLMCGPYSFSWSNTCRSVLPFQRSVKLAVTSPQWSEAGLDHINLDVLLELLQMQLDTGPEAEVWAQRRKGPDLLDFAYSMRRRLAGDPRDRIYALLGLSSKTSKEELQIDYSKGVEEIFKEFAAIVEKQTSVLCAQLDPSASVVNHLRRWLGWMRLIKLRLIRSPDQNFRSKRASSFQRASGGGDNEPITVPDVTGDTEKGMETVIEATCAQVLQHVRNNETWKAAQLLQNASMLLRGQSYGTNLSIGKEPS